VLSNEASNILGNFPETPDFPKIPEICPENLELLNLMVSFGDSGVSGGFPEILGLNSQQRVFG
jgi:hypothetical protein